jgi:hypothetical protein
MSFWMLFEGIFPRVVERSLGAAHIVHLVMSEWFPFDALLCGLAAGLVARRQLKK